MQPASNSPSEVGYPDGILVVSHMTSDGCVHKEVTILFSTVFPGSK